MKVLLKLEEVGIFLLCIFLFAKLNFAWWWFPALLFLPDIGMIGYIINPKIGAMTYNFFHFRLIASLVAICSVVFSHEYLQLAAIILFAHISLDRALGYGLKYNEGFAYTHLGMVGKKETTV
jgi:hypothetical protein